MKKKIFVSLVSIALLVGILSGCTEDTTTPTNTAPEASFTASYPVDMAVEFTDASTDADEDDTLTWAWDFGDGDTSEEQNPIHTYISNGVYTVTLIVSDGTDTDTSDDMIITIGTPPTAGITASEGNITVNTSAQFTDNSTKGDSNITSWSWDFGDDVGTSILQNPTYNYTAIGDYTVTLTVSDDDGLSDTINADVKVVEAAE